MVERLEELPEDFEGVAVTRAGRVWFTAPGEIRQLNEGGSERVLARRNERDRLLGALEQAAAREGNAREGTEAALAALGEAESATEAAAERMRAGERRHAEAQEAARRASG